MIASVIPQLPAGKPHRLPRWAVGVSGGLQSGALLALAVWAGVAFSPRVGLSAPVFGAVAARSSVWPALRPQLLPGTLGGLTGGAILLWCARFTPAALAAAKRTFHASLIVRVLYGGFTEELFVRWGAMSFLLWCGGKASYLPEKAPGTAWVWVAIVGSALFFAAGHLPAASRLAGGLTREITAYVLSGNTAFGILAGWLFWRHGLESAMLCHALAHVVAVNLPSDPETDFQ